MMRRIMKLSCYLLLVTLIYMTISPSIAKAEANAGILDSTGYIIASDQSVLVKGYGNILSSLGWNVAVCDGTDDQEDIQAVIDHLVDNAEQGDVRITTGRFNTSAPIVLKHGISLEGQGQERTKIYATDMTFAIIEIPNNVTTGNVTTGNRWFSLKKMKLTYGAPVSQITEPAATNPAAVGIKMTTDNGSYFTDQFLIEDVEVSCPYDGFSDTTRASLYTLNRVTVTYPFRYGFNFEGTTALLTTRITAEQLMVTGIEGAGQVAYRLKGVYNFSGTNLYIERMPELEDGTNVLIEDSTVDISGLFVTGSTIGEGATILRCENSDGMITNFHARNNIFDPATEAYAISVDSASDVVFVSPYVTSNTNTGLGDVTCAYSENTEGTLILGSPKIDVPFSKGIAFHPNGNFYTVANIMDSDRGLVTDGLELNLPLAAPWHKLSPLTSDDNNLFSCVIDNPEWMLQGRAFNGAGDFISIPDGSFWVDGKQTISVWFQPTTKTPSTWGFIYRHYSNDNRVYIGQHTSGNILVEIGTSEGNTASRIALLASDYNAGDWINIVAERDYTNRLLNVWVNNVQTLTDESVVINTLNTANSTLGYTSESFNGTVYDCQIYDGGLSEAERLRNYNITRWKLR